MGGEVWRSFMLIPRVVTQNTYCEIAKQLSDYCLTFICFVALV